MDNTFDKQYYSYGELIAGVDESGIVDIAGPIVAACVIFPKWDTRPDDTSIFEIADSKDLTDKAREERLGIILNHAIAIGIGESNPVEIDCMGVACANNLAMSRAIFNCLTLADKKPIMPDFLIVDGHKPIHLKIKQVTIKQGDKKSLSVAAASIIAKQRRDAIMKELHHGIPYYDWDKNKGFPSEAHLAGLDSYGMQIGIHRTRFWPFLGRPKEDLNKTHSNQKKWATRREKWKKLTEKRICNLLEQNSWSQKPLLLDHSMNSKQQLIREANSTSYVKKGKNV